LTVSAAKDQTCAGARLNGLNCTANDFTASAIFSAEPDTPPFCVAGQEFNFKAIVEISSGSPDRYDVGFFVGQQGNNPQDDTPGNICSVATFPTSGAPWANLSPNACGDLPGGSTAIATINEIKVMCQGTSVGALRIPYLLSYENSSSTCGGPNSTYTAPQIGVRPGTKSKCNAPPAGGSVTGVVSVNVGAYVDVTKQTSPDGDTKAFSFTASVPVGAKIVAQTAGVGTTITTDDSYTPMLLSAATNTVTVTITDNQTVRFFTTALSAAQTMTITEAASNDWETTSSISCGARSLG